MLALSVQAAQLQTTNTVIATQVSAPASPDFDRDVLAPLSAKQAEQAAEDARLAAIAAETARLERLDAIRARVKPFGTYSSGTYAWGQCTSYVASRIAVPPFLGNGGSWVRNLGAIGWTVSYEPVVGAIASSQQSYWGHVAIVEAVNGDGTVTISEMNYNGLNVIDERVASVSEFMYAY